MRILTFLFVIAFLSFDCQPAPENISASTIELPKEKMNGITLVAPSRPFSEDPMPPLKAIGTEWVAVIPYGFSPGSEAKVYFNSNRQWWGERPVGVKETIRLAKENDLKVLLKPQIWMHNGWIGSLDFDNEEDWKSWEEGYSDYILTFAKIADSLDVELFCIGTEVKIAVQKREVYWRGLIKEVRKVYKGKITYAANWDEYPVVPFWDAIDIVGVDTYFPLTDSKTPTVEELKKAWQPTLKKLRAFHKKTGKPIAFTEYGYMSIDGCAHKNWEIEKMRTEIPVNQQAQANAIDALFEVFWKEDWWAGGFLWKWYPNYKGEGQGRRAKFRAADYTPQGKLAENILKKWFEK